MVAYHYLDSDAVAPAFVAWRPEALLVAALRHYGCQVSDSYEWQV
jgi:hypothetical protein